MGMEIAKAYVNVQADTSQAPEDIKSGSPPVENAMSDLAGSLNGILATVGVGLGIARIMSEAQEAIGLASRQIDAEARVAAVVRTTGEAAGFSADELKEMASAMQNVTRTGDEALLETQAKFLTFKQIQGEVFERGIELTLDMAAVMGTDARSAAIQMAMALEDPVRGVTRLRRAGVTFSDQQREHIKVLVDSNKLFEAQSIVLEVIEGQLGGVAKAMAETDPGKIEQTENAIGDVQEEIGKKLMPLMIRFKKMTLETWEMIKVAVDAVAWVTRDVIGVFVELDALMGGALGPTLKWLIGTFITFTAIVVTATAVLKAFALVKAFVISLTGVGIPLVAAAAATAAAAMGALHLATSSMKTETEELATSAKDAGDSFKNMGKEAAHARKIAREKKQKEDVEAMGALSLQGLAEEKSKHKEVLELEKEKEKTAEKHADKIRAAIDALEEERGWLRKSEEFGDRPAKETFEKSIEHMKRALAVHEQQQTQALEKQKLVQEQLDAAVEAQEIIEQEIVQHQKEQHRQAELNSIAEIDSLGVIKERITAQKEVADAILQSHGPSSQLYQSTQDTLEALEDQKGVLEDNLDPLTKAEQKLADMRDGLSDIDIQVRDFAEGLGISSLQALRLRETLEGIELRQSAERWGDTLRTPFEKIGEDISQYDKLLEGLWQDDPEMAKRMLKHLQGKVESMRPDMAGIPLLQAGTANVGQFGSVVQQAFLQREEPTVEELKRQTKQNDAANTLLGKIKERLNDLKGGLAEGND